MSQSDPRLQEALWRPGSDCQINILFYLSSEKQGN